MRSADEHAPAEQACARLPAQPQAVLDLLNESRAFEPGDADAPPASALRAEDVAEQLLYEVQDLELPVRRRLMPRVYGFVAPQANSTRAPPPPPPLLAASAPRSAFGWPAGRTADAATAGCICLVAVAAAGAAFVLGARRVRLLLVFAFTLVRSCISRYAARTHRR